MTEDNTRGADQRKRREVCTARVSAGPQEAMRRRRRAMRTVCLLFLLAGVPAVAGAQESEPQAASPDDRPALTLTRSTYGSPNLTPNEFLPYGRMLDGSPLREMLSEKGIEFGLSYTGEAAANFAGARRDAAYADQLAFTNDIDFGRFAGIPGFSTHFAIVSRHGRNLSDIALDDHVTLATEIFGSTFGADVWLAFAFGELSLLDDRVSLAAGRLPFNNDFASSPIACNAVSLMPACPMPRALANQSPFTAFPRSGWGGRVRVRPGGGFYLQTGVYLDEDPPAGGSSGFDLDRDVQGALIPVELGWDTLDVVPGLPGHYKIGFAHDTASYDDLLLNVAGRPIGIDSMLPARRVEGKNSFWAMFDQMLVSHGERGRGLVLMGSYARSSPDTSFNSQTAFISVLDRGLVPYRPDDVVQLAAGWYGISDDASTLQKLSKVPSQSIQRNEYMFEASYTTSFMKGTSIQLAMQYFLYPNAQESVPDGAVVALRYNLKL